jgi:hypothetical protein
LARCGYLLGEGFGQPAGLQDSSRRSQTTGEQAITVTNSLLGAFTRLE